MATILRSLDLAKMALSGLLLLRKVSQSGMATGSALLAVGWPTQSQLLTDLHSWNIGIMAEVQMKCGISFKMLTMNTISSLLGQISVLEATLPQLNKELPVAMPTPSLQRMNLRFRVQTQYAFLRFVIRGERNSTQVHGLIKIADGLKT